MACTSKRPMKSNCGCTDCTCASKIPKREHPLCENGAVMRFRQYLRIMTAHPKPQYEQCVEFLKQQAKELDLEFKLVDLTGKPIVVLSLNGLYSYLPSILLMSHMDVVPAVPETWTYDPFGAVMTEQGLIYGRGAQGMKLHGIQYLEAVRKFKCEGKKLKRNVHLLFLPDSEIGGDKGMKVFVNSSQFKELNVGFALDQGMPSTSNQYLIGYNERALWQILIQCTGTSGDAGLLPNNIATERVFFLLRRMLAYRENGRNQIKNDNLDSGNVTSVNLTRIQGGILSNVIASDIRMIFDVRISPTCNAAQDFEQSLKSWCQEAGKCLQYEYLRKDRVQKIEPLNERDPWWRTLKNVYDRNNCSFRLIVLPYDSDARFLRELCIPVLGFTALINTQNLFHCEDEFIDAKEFLSGIDLYQKIIVALANTDF